MGEDVGAWKTKDAGKTISQTWENKKSLKKCGLHYFFNLNFYFSCLQE